MCLFGAVTSLPASASEGERLRFVPVDRSGLERFIPYLRPPLVGGEATWAGSDDPKDLLNKSRITNET